MRQPRAYSLVNRTYASRPRQHADRTIDQTASVQRAVDAERATQSARTGRDHPVGQFGRRTATHGLNAPHGLQCADQDRARFPVASRDRVHAVVHPVGEVHVRDAGRAEHDLGPSVRCSVRVGARVAGAPVRLDLYDPSALDAPSFAADQIASEQIVRDIRDVSFVEPALQSAVEVRGVRLHEAR